VFISLEELKLHRMTVSKTYPAGALDYHTADFRQSGALKVDAVAELVGSEVRIRRHLATRVEAICDRCVGPVELPVELDFDLFYRPVSTIAREEEVEISPDELGIGFYSGDGIELDDVIAEQVNLFMPMKVVCGADCRGLCPVCGANRNLDSCDCAPLRRDSPFASLLE